MEVFNPGIHFDEESTQETQKKPTEQPIQQPTSQQTTTSHKQIEQEKLQNPITEEKLTEKRIFKPSKPVDKPNIFTPPSAFKPPLQTIYNAPPLLHETKKIVTPPPPTAMLSTTTALQNQQGSTLPSFSQTTTPLTQPLLAQQSSLLAPKKQGLDTSTIPNPAHSASLKKTLYRTVNSEVPPPATSRYSVFDEGNCSCKFMRSTLNRVPYTSSLLKQSNLYLGVIMQPLASLSDDDFPSDVKQVSFPEGPIRCNRCRAYINPFVQFIEHGAKFVCNFCGFANPVPEFYQCPLDYYGKRRDLEDRPELQYGTVDFVATKPYMNREPAPMDHIFVIEATKQTISQGIVKSIIESMKSVVKEVAKTCGDCRIAFVTFNSAIYYYNLTGGSPQIIQVGDLDSAFVPLPKQKLFIKASEWAKNESLFDKLLKLIGTTEETTSALGCAVLSAKLSLQESGGNIKVFASKLPDSGMGKTGPRDYRLYGTDSERALFIAEDDFYIQASQECAKHKISVDTFLFPMSFVDAATLGAWSNLTGGQIYAYTLFNHKQDYQRLFNDLKRNMTRDIGYDAFLKLRCSTGLRVKRYIGNFFKQVHDDIEITSIDGDSTIACELLYDGDIEKTSNSYLQCALLYTSRKGQRLIRVHTMRLKVASTISEVFRYADLDATFTMMSKLAITQLLKNRDSVEIVRDTVNERLTSILAAYRRNCSQLSPLGQLVLPEALKLLPIYVLGFLKSPAMRPGVDVPMDERIVYFNYVMKMSVQQILLYSFPRLISLHKMPDPVVDTDGKEYNTPPILPLSISKIDSSGVFLLDDGITTHIWIGKEAPKDIIYAIVGKNTHQITPSTQPNPDLESKNGKRIDAILKEIKKGKSTFGRIRMHVEKHQGEEQFFVRLIEDRSKDYQSYVDYLCFLHKEIQQKVSN